MICVGLRGECYPVSLNDSSGLFGALERFGGLLECVFLPCLLAEVPALCFRNSSLSRVTFGSGSVLKRIGNSAFSGCKALREIEIPASVEVVGNPGVVVRRV